MTRKVQARVVIGLSKETDRCAYYHPRVKREDEKRYHCGAKNHSISECTRPKTDKRGEGNGSNNVPSKAFPLPVKYDALCHVMTANSELEQSVAIPDLHAVRRPRLSPRAAQGDAPHAVVQQQTAAQTGTVQPGATSESSQRLMAMDQEMIMTIQTSADGVRTEQQTMESVFQTRSRVLSEHLAEVSRGVVRTTQSGQPSSVWTRSERLHSETEEVHALKARLECTEHNMRDLAAF
eukprot:6479259-Amphidinium_carterae.5